MFNYCFSFIFKAVASTASSSKENTNRNILPPTMASENESTDDAVPTKKQKKQKFRVKSTPRSEMLQWLKEYEKKNDIKEEERKEFLKQQHEETTNLLKDIFKKITD